MPFIPTCVAQQSPGHVGKTMSSSENVKATGAQSGVKSMYLYRDEPMHPHEVLPELNWRWNRNTKALGLGTWAHRCCMGAKTARSLR